MQTWPTGKYLPALHQTPDGVIQLIRRRYQVSKLLQVFPCRELASRVKQSGKGDVIINYINPGLCHSELARDAPLWLHVMKFFLARSTEHGSRSLVNAVEGGEETHGQYLSDCQVAQYV